MVFVIWSALLLAAFRMMPGWWVFDVPPEIINLRLAFLVVILPMPLLCVLLRLLDRRGPVRSWYISCCGAGELFLIGASFVIVEPVNFALSGRSTALFRLLLFNGLISVCAGIIQLRTVWPRRCQRCGRRAVIATTFPTSEGFRRAPPERRRKAQGWCAICGQEYEREGSKAWQLKVP